MSEQNHFHVKTSITASQAREFLDRAAHDEEFRQRLDDAPLEVLAEYGIELNMDVTSSACRAPSPEYCEMLLTRIDEVEEYAAAEYAPIALAKVVLTVGYAMPLVATADGEARTT